MRQYLTTIWCAGCGVEITWMPYMQGNHEYCCEDCVRGYACKCGSRMDMEDERRTAQPSAEFV